MKRQRGRGRRSGGGNNNNPNKHFESNGPDVKIRGSAQQILDKYMQYARDAQSSGDRVNAENYLQHAEHYYRVLAAMQPKEKPREERVDSAQQAEGEAAASEGTETQAEGEEAASSADGGEQRRGRGRGRRREREPRAKDEAVSEETSEDAVAAADAAPAEAEADAAPAEAAEEKPKPRRRTTRKREKVEADSEVADDGIMKTLSRGRKKKADAEVPTADVVEASAETVPNEPSTETAESV